MSMLLSGIGIARGIVIGKVHHVYGGARDVSERKIASSKLDAECQRYQAAREAACEQLQSIRASIPSDTPEEISAFMDAHVLMLGDHALAGAVTDLIHQHRCNAEWALRLQRDALVAVFEQMDDPYLRTRKNDVDHVVDSIQRVLLNQETPFESTANHLSEQTVVVADDLSPADLVAMHSQGLRAFVTELGAPLSHTSILARSLSIPSIVGVRNIRLLKEGEALIIDGKQGSLIAAPDARTISAYEKKQVEEQLWLDELATLKDKPAITKDGVQALLCANIELPQDVRACEKHGAEGIGLYRTEFLYMNRDSLPTEEQQYDAYVTVIKAMKGKPITIRTLDLGADKQIDGGSRINMPVANNPALGLRAIRLCLKDLDLFRVQIRALLRAAAVGPIKIMLPMIGNRNEIRSAKTLISEVREQLLSEGVAVPDGIPIGAMIEVPAAALCADSLADEVDFFSIGTNDLIQYTLAIDRVDDEVNYLYQPLHPGVLKLIQMTIDAGKRNNIPVSMCGEMAGDPRYAALLFGMGLREFSMHPTSLLEVKHLISSSNQHEMKDLADKVLQAKDAEDARQILAL
jgi:phosphotransferase system enzyme I (PtsI)